MTTKKILKALNGCEVWTNALGERTCVTIEIGNCWANGKKFKPTKKQAGIFFEDYCENEGINAEVREIEATGEF